MTHLTDSSVAFHRFPKDPELLQKWIRAMARENFVPTEHSRLCSLHFHAGDFVEVRTDKNVTRLKKKPEKPLRRILKEGSVPFVFVRTLSYPRKSPAAGVTTTTTAGSCSRHADEVEELTSEQLETSFTASDDISTLSLADVQAKLQTETAVPTGFTYTLVDDSLLINLPEMNEDISNPAACIAVKSGMTVTCSMQDKVVLASQYSDLVECRVQQLSQLVSLMARLKSWFTDASLCFYIQTAVTVLETALGSLPDTEREEFGELASVIELLRLPLRSKYSQQYSPQLTYFGFLLHSVSFAWDEEKLIFEGNRAKEAGAGAVAFHLP